MSASNHTLEPTQGSTPFAARVLLVEDDELSLEFAHQLLVDAGLTVVRAMTAQSAVELAQAQRFDLILMDLQLPDFDGCEATRRIRRLQPNGTQVSIVALTANLRASDQARCRQAGMDGCEAKPLTRKALDRLVAQHLRSNPGAGQKTTEQHGLGRLSAERLQQLFRDSAARLVAEIKSARANADRSAVLRAAHRLKSVCAHAAMTSLMHASAQLESVARDAAAPLDPFIDAVLATYAATEQGPQVSLDQPAAAAAQQPVGPLVLVVDDDENERFLVRRTLEQAGYRVQEQDGGRAAVDYCRNQLPDAVLLDGLMPDVDGIATCRLLRAEFPPERLPILMYTGLDDPIWRTGALEAGVDAFVDKSICIDDLAGILSTALTACGLPGRK